MGVSSRGETMKTDLSQLRDENVSSISLKGEINMDLLDIGGRKIKFINPIEYDGEIYKVDGDKIIDLKITYTYEEDCGRCLEPFVREEITTLSGELVRKTDEIIEDEEKEIIYYSDEKLDITDDIIDMIVLSLPMKPLCSDECKGICPQCGTNLNREKCNCVVEDTDPRFAILKDLDLND